jgi:uncharacterized protein with FMN-binding domain
MPKRGVLAILLTTGALVLLLSFKTPATIDRASGADAAVAAAAASAPPAAVAAPTRAPALPGASTAPVLPPTTAPTQAPVAAAPTPVPTVAPTEAPTTDGTILGDAVRIRWGTVQVQVTVSDGRITDVVAVQLPDNDPRSSQISSYAEPALRESALTSQSASIDIVSGATFTSRAYAQSLQSALDQARAQG